MNPKRIKGAWSDGYTLDDHTTSSMFLGYNEQGHPQFDTARSDLGEALYRLKYKNDRSPLGWLAKETATFVRNWGIALDVVVPVPRQRIVRCNLSMRLAKPWHESWGFPATPQASGEP